ncbi:UNVERIFIED_CONTAM: hypothetical protein Sradi_0218700 [Sesamum radiatum]|uniref:Uncharacterized protein n=1 Tax=Sesamum radiatum TaxID=300843 RepID=A0AAW2W166_SESRA
MAETSAAGAERQGAEREAFPETLQLHGSDHPGMILVSTTPDKYKSSDLELFD